MSSNAPGPFGSNNPYAGSHNPYAANPTYSYGSSQSGGIDPGQQTQLTVVASFLLAMAVLTLGAVLVNLAIQFVRGAAFEVPPELQGPARTGFLFGQIGAVVIQVILQVVVIVGSIAMIRRRSIELGWAATTCSMIPCCGPCLGFSIPFAIWGLVLLSRPGVKAAFS